MDAIEHIRVEISGNSSDLSAAAKNASRSLEELATMVKKQAAQAVSSDESIVKSNQAVSGSYGEMATAAKSSSAEVSAAAKQAAGAQKAAAAEADTAASTQVAAARRTGKAFGEQHSQMARFGRNTALALTAAGAASIYMAAKFEASTAQMETQAGAAHAQVQKFRGELTKMAGELGQTPIALSEGLYHIVSSMDILIPKSRRASVELGILREAAKGAAIGGSDLKETAYALSSVMNSFKETTIPGARKEMAALNAIVGSGDMHMRDLVDALKSGIVPTAETFGVSLHSVGAALAYMTDRGAPATISATRLRMALALIAAPTEQATKILKTLGLSQDDATKRTSAMAKALQKAGVSTTQLSSDLRKPNGIYVALMDLRKQLTHAGLTAEEQAATISRAFGGGKMGSAIQSLYLHLDVLRDKYIQQGKMINNYDSAWSTTQKTLSFQMHQFEGQLSALAVTWGTKLIPKAEAALTTFKNIEGWLGRNKVAADALALVISGVLSVALTAWFISLGRKVVGAVAEIRGLSTAFDGLTRSATEASVATQAAVSPKGGGMLSGGVGGAARTLGGRALAGGGVALAGTMTAQMAGQVVGGKSGKTISDVGTWAALGAGIGTAIEPGLGTAIGAAVGASAKIAINALKPPPTDARYQTVLRGPQRFIAPTGGRTRAPGQDPMARGVTNYLANIQSLQGNLDKLTPTQIIRVEATLKRLAADPALAQFKNQILDAERSFKNAASGIGASAKSIALSLKGPKARALDVIDSFRGIETQGGSILNNVESNVKANMSAITRDMDVNSAAGKNAIRANFLSAEGVILDSMNHNRITTAKGMAEIQKLMAEAMKNYGLTAKDVQPYFTSTTRDSKGNASTVVTPVSVKATGGYIGAAGERGADTVPVVVGRGEAILNHQQQRVVNGALAVTTGGDLGDLFNQTRTTRHYMASGGFAGSKVVTASEFGGPSDPGSAGKTASGRTNNAGLIGWAELSHLGSLDFSALGHVPMGTLASIRSMGKTIRAPKVDVGAGGPGLNGHPRAVDLTYGLAQRFGWGPNDLRDIVISLDGKGMSAAGGGGLGYHGAIRGGGIPGLAADHGLRGIAGALDHALRLATAAQSVGGVGGGGSFSGKGLPAGIGSFEGTPVAKWIIPELNYARAHGWKGHITSGYRPPGQVVNSPVKAPQGKSEHQGTSYPGGAVDFGGPFDAGAAANRAAFVAATQGYTGPRLLLPQGFRDDGHMSGTGHASGGFASAAKAKKKKGKDKGPKTSETLGGRTSTEVTKEWHRMAALVEHFQNLRDSKQRFYEAGDATMTDSQRQEIIGYQQQVLDDLGIEQTDVTELLKYYGLSTDVGADDSNSAAAKTLRSNKKKEQNLTDEKRVLSLPRASAVGAIQDKIDAVRKRYRPLIAKAKTPAARKDLRAKEQAEIDDLTRQKKIVQGKEAARRDKIAHRKLAINREMDHLRGSDKSMRSKLAKGGDLHAAYETLPMQILDEQATMKDLSKGGSATTDNAALAALLQQQNTDLLKTLALSREDFKVFQNFGRMFAGMPAFAHGTGFVSQTGPAIVHRGEAIIPDPSGPYGSQLGGSPTTLNLHLHGGLDSVVSSARLESDDRTARDVSATVGRRTRLLIGAPGR